MDGFGGAADVMGTGHAKPFAGWHPANTLTPPARALNFVNAFRQPVAVDHQVIHGARWRLQKVGTTHGDRIESDLTRHAINQTFEGMTHVDRPMPAHGA